MGFWSNIFGKGGSYFLEEETAKGLGDTEYMKQTKAVRRTFPAGGGGEEFEMTRQVSAIDKTVYDSRKGGAAPAAASAAASAPAPAASTSTSSWGSASSGWGSASSTGWGSASTPAAATPEPAAPAPVAATPAPEPAAPAPVAATPAPEPAAPAAPAPTPEPAAPDNSMDMFRNMAKKIGR